VDITTLGVPTFTLSDYVTLVDSALNQWASVSKFSNLGQVADGGGAAGVPGALGSVGDIRIGAWSFTASSILAHNFAPGSAISAGGNNIFGDMHIRTNGPTWIDNPTDNAGDGSTDYDLYTVVLHELGHALGLGHTDIPGSVMRDSYMGGRRVLGPDDIAGIQALYGAPGIAHFIVTQASEGVNIASGKSPNDVFSLGATPKEAVVFFTGMDGTNIVETPPPGLGLMAGDNIGGISNGTNGTVGGSGVLMFSVDASATGMVGTDLYYSAVLSPAAAAFGGTPPGNPGGGDPGSESAGDIYASSLVPAFGLYPGVVTPIVAYAGKNRLFADEGALGLQAPALNGASGGAPEDDLDGMELDGGGAPSYFTLQGGSPTLTPALTVYDLGTVPVVYPISVHMGGETRTPDDIFFGGGAAIFAPGHTMGLVMGDEIDALVVSDITRSNSPPPVHTVIAPNGFLDPGFDSALFSLSPGSPTLGLGGYLPGDVFITAFGGGFSLYASAGSLGLLPGDNIDALDIRIGELPPGIGQFLGTTPEPSTFVLAALALVFMPRRRRAQRAA
jgi:hypothetical protein